MNDNCHIKKEFISPHNILLVNMVRCSQKHMQKREITVVNFSLVIFEPLSVTVLSGLTYNKNCTPNKFKLLGITFIIQVLVSLEYLLQKNQKEKINCVEQIKLWYK